MSLVMPYLMRGYPPSRWLYIGALATASLGAGATVNISPLNPQAGDLIIANGVNGSLGANTPPVLSGAAGTWNHLRQFNHEVVGWGIYSSGNSVTVTAPASGWNHCVLLVSMFRQVARRGAINIDTGYQAVVGLDPPAISVVPGDLLITTAADFSAATVASYTWPTPFTDAGSASLDRGASASTRSALATTAFLRWRQASTSYNPVAWTTSMGGSEKVTTIMRFN